MLQIEGLFKSFQQAETKIPALEDVNFSIDRSETVAIVGPSGGGKTTLLSMLAGLEPPSSGSIKINNTDLVALSEYELSQFRARHIGIVFQQFHLMPHLTALENVSLPLEIAHDPGAGKKAASQLSLVGLENRLHHLPSQLSGGECQRVAIARASIIEPSILLADEPSGNLDHESGEKVMSLLFSLVQEKQMTLILVTHDLDLAKRCKRQIHLSGGRVQ